MCALQDEEEHCKAICRQSTCSSMQESSKGPHGFPRPGRVLIESAARTQSLLDSKWLVCQDQVSFHWMFRKSRQKAWQPKDAYVGASSKMVLKLAPTPGKSPLEKFLRRQPKK